MQLFRTYTILLALKAVDLDPIFSAANALFIQKKNSDVQNKLLFNSPRYSLLSLAEKIATGCSISKKEASQVCLCDEGIGF